MACDASYYDKIIKTQVIIDGVRWVPETEIRTKYITETVKIKMPSREKLYEYLCLNNPVTKGEIIFCCYNFFENIILGEHYEEYQ